MKRILLGIVLVLILALSAVPQMAFAEPFAADDEGGAPKLQGSGEHAQLNAEKKTARRTILLYMCGSDLESAGAKATHNLMQIIRSKFSSDDDINFIIITGGCTSWKFDDDKNTENENGYLIFPDDVNVPDDAVLSTDPDTKDPVVHNRKGSISNIYNQIWEARGADSPENAGKLVLLDGDGLTGAEGEAVKNKDELLSDPETLKAFINYGVEKYPAEKYDLILWDHGGGPQEGFGYDDNYDEDDNPHPELDLSHMEFSGIVDALAHNKVVDSDSDGKPDSKFDFVDFDACLMGSVEIALVMADYTRFYISSADTEPGYGQYYGPRAGSNYTGWLDELGDPEKDAVYNADDGSFALGKVIVDDYYEFYSDDNSDGRGLSGTLSICDTEKMLADADFMNALSELSRILKAEAEGDPSMFYDELRAFYKTIHYSKNQLFDLADLAAFLGIADSEVNDDPEDFSNAYTDLAKTFGKLFRRSYLTNIIENDFMYAKCTNNEVTNDHYHYDEDSPDHREFGLLFSSGMTIFLPDPELDIASLDYYSGIEPVLESMPVKDDGRYRFLKDHEEVVADYSIIQFIGNSISSILNDEKAFYPDENPVYGNKSIIDLDYLIKIWSEKDNDMWNKLLKVNLSKRSAGVDGSMPWLRRLVSQLTEDALLVSGIDVTEVQHDGTTGYSIDIKEGSKRILRSVEQNISAELPALNSYLETLDPLAKNVMARRNKFFIGTVEGYNAGGSIWDIPPVEQKWYAINDADGQYHVASIYSEIGDLIRVPVASMSEDGKKVLRLLVLNFEKQEDEKGNHKLRSVYFTDNGSGTMSLDPEKLTDELIIMPVILLADSPSSESLSSVPISKAEFRLSKDNAASVTLDFTDVKNIPDIEDTSGDGSPLKVMISVNDLFDSTLDITSRINKTMKHISLAKVEPSVYNGKEQIPVVTYEGKILRNGIDYAWEKVSDVIGDGENEQYIMPDYKNAREYDILLTGKGEFTGFSSKKFVIQKAANKLNARGKTAKVSFSKLKKKNQKLPVSRIIKFKNRGNGTKTYKKTGGTSKISINKKNGKVTVKKGLKKGTYKITVQIKAAATKNYKAATKTVNIKIKVR